MKSVVILASGNGSNFEAIVRKIRSNNWPIEVRALITDNPGAYVLIRAQRLKIPYEVLNFKCFPNKVAYNTMLFERLKANTPDLIILAGYMRILPGFIVEHFRNKIINIHPALLPAFPGVRAIERAYEAGCKVTGITIHYVDERVDSGPIIEQVCTKVRKGESLESLEKRIHRLEHKFYPLVIKKLLLGD
ncbi:MAG TPA: phosphoribosylglycinamide formyltransferase [Candidatus Hydrothermia bacterium]|nr:phosphoribosylglycinamide formyltransferase [Candidatus Hydrothermia bacterium]